MRFTERNDLANLCKKWMKDQIENNITTPLDTVHMVLVYLDVNGYLNEVVRCKDCKWYESNGKESSYGYCHAMKHCHYSKHWEISIYRTYNEDFFCADAERREEE